MNAPLKHQAQIPNNQECGNGGGSDGGATFLPRAGEPVEEGRQSQDEQRCQRDEEAIAEGGHAVPVRMDGDYEVKEQEGRNGVGGERSIGAAKKYEAD